MTNFMVNQLVGVYEGTVAKSTFIPCIPGSGTVFRDAILGENLWVALHSVYVQVFLPCETKSTALTLKSTVFIMPTFYVWVNVLWDEAPVCASRLITRKFFRLMSNPYMSSQIALPFWSHVAVWGLVMRGAAFRGTILRENLGIAIARTLLFIIITEFT